MPFNMIESKKYRVATFLDGEFVKYGYPHRYIDVEMEVDGDIKFYIVEDVQPETYNIEQYSKTALELEITTEQHEDFPHCFKAYRRYELSEYSSTQILTKIDNNCDSHIEENYSVLDQNRDSARYLRLDYYRGVRDLTEDEVAELIYINSLNDWNDECTVEANSKKSEYLNDGVFPDLQTWPEKPIKN